MVVNKFTDRISITLLTVDSVQFHTSLHQICPAIQNKLPVKKLRRQVEGSRVRLV